MADVIAAQQRAQPAVTAVVVAWRSAAVIGECLESLLAQDYPGPWRVLVVDNDADDATRAVLARYAARRGVQVLRSPVNAGFAGGVALALSQVEAPLALVINDDATAAPDVVRLLVAAAEAGERPAAVQAAVRLADGDPALTNSSGLEVTPDGFGYDRDWLGPWESRQRSAAAFGVSGAAALLRTAAVARAGGMDADLFLYYEDVDLSWRLRLAGFEVGYQPDAVVSHRHATSSGEGSAVFRYYNERNRLLVLARNASPGLALTQWLRYPLTTASITLARGPQRAQTWSRVRAAAGALRHLPRALARRRRPPPLVSRRSVESRFRAAPPQRGPYRSFGSGSSTGRAAGTPD